MNSSDNLQIMQHSLANLNIQQTTSNVISQSTQSQGSPTTSTTSQYNTEIVSDSQHSCMNSTNLNNTSSNISQQQMVPLSDQNNVPNQQSTLILSEQEEQQLASEGFSKRLLQMVAANQSLQKIVQHYYDQPKSPSESPPSDPVSTSPTKASAANSKKILEICKLRNAKYLIIISDSDLADLSRIFCEVMQDIKSELTTAQDYVQVHQHNNSQKNVMPQYILQQQNIKLNSSQSPGKR